MRRILCALLAVCLLLSCVPKIHAAAEFTDVSGHWAERSILRVRDLGLMTGTSATTFEPETVLSRAMFVVVLYRLHCRRTGQTPPACDAAARFTDVPDGLWFTAAVAWAAKNGIVKGTSKTTFSPNDPCTREQAVVLVYRYLAWLGLPAEGETWLGIYNDAYAISRYARRAVSWAVSVGLLKGTGGGRLAPLARITRAEFAVILCRIVDLFEGKLRRPAPVARPEAPAASGESGLLDQTALGQIYLLDGAPYLPLETLTSLGAAAAPSRKDGCDLLTLTFLGREISFCDGYADAQLPNGAVFDLGAPTLRAGETWYLPAAFLERVLGFAWAHETEARRWRWCALTQSPAAIWVNGGAGPAAWSLNGVICAEAEALAGALGAPQPTRTGTDCTLTLGGHSLRLTPGSASALLDGSPVALSCPVMERSGLLYCPAGDCAAALGWSAAKDPLEALLHLTRAEAYGKTVWINGARLATPRLLGGRPCVRLGELASALGTGTKAGEGTLSVTFSGRTLTFRPNSIHAALGSGETLLPIPAAADGGDWLVPLEQTVSALGLTALDDPAWNEIFYTKIAKNNAIARGYRVPVLMYHAVSDNIWGIPELFISPSGLEAQLRALVNNGYTAITFEDLDHISSIRKPVLLTFDDGYKDNYTELFPLLKKYNVKATVFVIVDAIGNSRSLTRAQIKEMSDSGLVSIQSHTMSHNYLDEMNESQLYHETYDSMLALARITGKQPFVLCYPTGRSSALARTYAARYYQFGLCMGGPCYTTGAAPFQIYRYYIPRGTSVSTFLSYLG